MFGIFRQKVIHEPVSKQKEDLIQSLGGGEFGSVLAQSMLSGLDCDMLPSVQGEFGSRNNPIPVNGSIGEIKYLVKLRGETGQPILFHRVGSLSSKVVKNPVDCYEIVCVDGTQWGKLYFDFYHPRRSNIAPSGYTLTPFDKNLGMDMPYGFGCNSLVNNFPYGLPNVIIACYGDSIGKVFAHKVEKYLSTYLFDKPI